VVSLWSVDDEATAELMKRFYHGMVVENLAPPAALRKAQMTLESDARWRAPYYWGAFVLQGEWKSFGPPSARRVSWRMVLPILLLITIFFGVWAFRQAVVLVKKPKFG